MPCLWESSLYSCVRLCVRARTCCNEKGGGKKDVIRERRNFSAKIFLIFHCHVFLKQKKNPSFINFLNVVFWIFSAENRQQAVSALTSELASLCASQRRPIAIHQLACLKAGGETLCDFASSLARLIQFSVPSKTLCALHLYWARGGNNQPAIRVYSPLKRQCPNWYYVCFIFIFNLYSTHLKALGESDESCNTFRCKYFFKSCPNALNGIEVVALLSSLPQTRKCIGKINMDVYKNRNCYSGEEVQETVKGKRCICKKKWARQLYSLTCTRTWRTFCNLF